MTLLEAVKKRHAVRSYRSEKIPADIRKQLQNEIDRCNKEKDLHIQLITDDADVFSGLMARYGKFHNVQNCIALIGRKAGDLDEKAGYCGEKLALTAQMLGLNTCWVAMTFNKGAAKKKFRIERDEKLVCILALGYGENQGVLHEIKNIKDVCPEEKEEEMPVWYRNGIECALLAPTAMNQQKFRFSRSGNVVSVKPTGGFYSGVDLGIVKYHFEAGAGAENFRWA